MIMSAITRNCERMISSSESNPVGPSTGVVDLRDLRAAHTPLIPHLLVIAETPHVQDHLAPCFQIHRVL